MRVDDVRSGNRDGVVGNEGAPANVVMQRGPWGGLGATVWPSMHSTSTVRANEARLRTFLADAEARWGARVCELERPKHVTPADWVTFLLGKAILLERYGLHPSDVSESVVEARGGLDGVDIAPRDLFVQRFRPLAPWNGALVVVAPGYGQTGRHFAEQAVLAARAGYEVVIFDQQWLGLSEGRRGAVDRGLGVARDVTSVTADASARLAKTRSDVLTIIAGTSMGGMGTVTAICLNEMGRSPRGDGPAMPARVGAVLQAPYFGLHPSLTPVAWVSSWVPGLGSLPVPRLRVGRVTQDPVAANKLLAHAIIEQASARAQALWAPDDDRARLASLLDAHPSSSEAPPIHMIHTARDMLADHAATVAWCERLGPRAKLTTLDSANHAFAESPSEQGHFLVELEAVRERMRGGA